MSHQRNEASLRDDQIAALKKVVKNCEHELVNLTHELSTNSRLRWDTSVTIAQMRATFEYMVEKCQHLEELQGIRPRPLPGGGQQYDEGLKQLTSQPLQRVAMRTLEPQIIRRIGTGK